jgi:adenine deaminase
MHRLKIMKAIDVAMGRIAPELYIKNCRLVNVISGEINKKICIGVSDGIIAWVGEDLLNPGDNTTIIDAAGSFAMPGFLDGHMHIESSMLTFREFSKSVLRWGTTTVFPDPHEIANVCGLEGVKALVEESKNYYLRSFMLLPSCVPALKGSETSGAEINSDLYCQNIVDNDFWGMGEMMNYPGVANNDSEVLYKIAETRKYGKPLTGHITSEDPHMTNAYAVAGVNSCHESVNAEQVLQKLRVGICAMIREGSAWKDVKECIKPFIDGNLDTSNVMLVTDDSHADTIFNYGHMNHVVNRAIEEGLNPVKAIQMATINTATHFGLSNKLGSIAPGRMADIVIAPDINKIIPEIVICRGKVIFTKKNGYLIEFPEYKFPEFMKSSIKINRILEENDFDIVLPKYSNTILYPVIKVKENSVLTFREDINVNIENGVVCIDIDSDILKVACIDRHSGSGRMATSLIKGFGIKSGAIAQTIAHDCHNIIVLGTNNADMLKAVELLKESGGGICVVENGQLLAHHKLEIGGLMSSEPMDKVVASLVNIKSAYKQLGCKIQSPFMTLSLIALPVIPHLRLTDKGLFDVNNFKFMTF